MGLVNVKWGRWIDLVVDAVTRAFTTINYEHHEVHSGNHYFLRDYASVGIANYDISLTTPNDGKQMHSLVFYRSGAGCTVEAYEGASVSAGTEVTPLNSRRASSKTSGVVFRYAPTVASTGSLIYRMVLGIGTNPSNVMPGSGTRGSELILKPNTTYLVRFVSTAASNTIAWDFEFYMHADREAVI